jgi:hypothetical protein
MRMQAGANWSVDGSYPPHLDLITGTTAVDRNSHCTAAGSAEVSVAGTTVQQRGWRLGDGNQGARDAARQHDRMGWDPCASCCPNSPCQALRPVMP